MKSRSSPAGLSWSGISSQFLTLQNTNTSGLDSQSHIVFGEMKKEQGQGLQQLGQLLSKLKWYLAIDQRDKVYGALGVSSCPQLVRPDYNASLEQYYFQTAFSIIQDTKNLSILKDCASQPSFEDTNCHIGFQT